MDDKAVYQMYVDQIILDFKTTRNTAPKKSLTHCRFSVSIFDEKRNEILLGVIKIDWPRIINHFVKD